MLHACALTIWCFLGDILSLPTEKWYYSPNIFVAENQRKLWTVSQILKCVLGLSQNILKDLFCCVFFFRLNFAVKIYLTRLVPKTVIILLSQYNILIEEGKKRSLSFVVKENTAAADNILFLLKTTFGSSVTLNVLIEKMNC